MTYSPPHLNQFHDEQGDPWPPTVWPNGQAVSYSGNCWATTTGMAILYELQGDCTHPRVAGGFQCTGHEAPTPPRVRYWSGQHDSGGHPDDMVAAAHHWRADLRIFYGMEPDEVRRRVTAGQPLIVSTDYGLIRDVWSCQPDFDEGHSIFVRDLQMHDFEGKGGFGRVLAARESDPLCNTVRLIPWAQLAAAANAYTKGPGFTVVAPHLQEDVMALFDYQRGRVVDVPKGTALRAEPDGARVAVLAGPALAIPVVGRTKDGDHVALGFSRVNAAPMHRVLWVPAAAAKNPRIETAPLDPAAEAAIRREEQAKAAEAVAAACREEQAKAATIRTDLAEARAAFAALKTKVVTRLTAEGKDADAFLADVSDDTIG